MTSSTADRVLAVLELFAGERNDWSVDEAARALGLPVSTAYRYFASLARSELLIADLPGRYVLGPAIIRFDRQIRLHDPLIRAAVPAMEDLSASVGGHHAILLLRLYHARVMCVHVEAGGAFPPGIGYQRGKPIALDRGAGSKSILAHLPPRLLRTLAGGAAGGGDPVLPMTPALKREMRQIREQGYSMTLGELDPGFRGLAVPLFGAGGLEGSLAIAVPAEQGDVAKMLADLRTARDDVERRLARRLPNEADGRGRASTNGR